MSLSLNASEEAGRIVVATEIEIIKGNLAIGSAAVKKPILSNVKNLPIMSVQML